MEFRGIVNLDPHISNQLSRYLEVKETVLAKAILNSVGPSLEKMPEPEAPLINTKKLTLSEAILLFGKKLRSISLTRDYKPPKEFVEFIATEINRSLWNYLEILENSITELFLQINLLKGFEWKEDLFDVVHEIKMTLMHHFEDLEWAYKRLNAQLSQLGKSLENQSLIKKFKNFLTFSHYYLDPSILKNVQKSRKYLAFEEGKFHDEYSKYQNLHQNVKKKLLRFMDYKVLEKLYSESKDAFIKVYELLKMWEINQKEKLIPTKKLEVPLKNLKDPKRMFHIFEEYHTSLVQKLYDEGRMIKYDADLLLENEELRNERVDELTKMLKEVRLLGETVASYRDFLLKSDPNPYIRSRLGFPEWIVGTEPILTKSMLLLNYDIEETNKELELFIESVKTTHESDDYKNLNTINDKNDKYLHEMSQPLISESTTKSLAKQVLSELELAKELTSFDKKSMDVVGKTLSKLLKHDWKYQVVFEISEFDKIYSTHIGMLSSFHEERLHINRLNDFRRLCKEIKDTVKLKTPYTNLQEIELNLNDIKSGLQDFLGYVQRLANELNHPSHRLKDIEFQLLEYRYFFGKYFYELKHLEEDKQLIRSKFIFVDQYLDTAEAVIQNIHFT